MKSLYPSRNKEERSTDSQHRHASPHQHQLETQTALPTKPFTSSPTDETSLQMPPSSMSSFVHSHTQENAFTHFTTFTTDIDIKISHSSHSTNLNNNRSLENQQNIQYLHPNDVRF
jgi:hypothetical protein